MGNHSMAIIHISYTPSYRLRLDDGSYVFMPFYRYLGPMGFYRDRAELREIPDWWENPLICKALDWFCNRGNRC